MCQLPDAVKHWGVLFLSFNMAGAHLYMHEKDINEAAPHRLRHGAVARLRKRWRPPTLPHCIAVPSAQAGLTSLFGMGRGGTPPQ